MEQRTIEVTNKQRHNPKDKKQYAHSMTREVELGDVGDARYKIYEGSKVRNVSVCEFCFVENPEAKHYIDGEWDDCYGVFIEHEMWVSWCRKDYIVLLTEQLLVDKLAREMPMQIKSFHHCDDHGRGMATAKVRIPMKYSRLLALSLSDELALRFIKIPDDHPFITRAKVALKYETEQQTEWRIKLRENPRWKEGIVTINLQWRM